MGSQRRKFSAEYKDDAVKLVVDTGPDRLTRPDDIELWAIFEHSRDQPASPLIHGTDEYRLAPDDPKITEAFNTLGLTWATN